jgi:50S ribosomal protein L16 3-hydroxylase
MDVSQAQSLLGGLSAAGFMRRHWQKKPLLVRQALPNPAPPLARAGLFELAASDDVESRLVVQHEGGWALRHGPIPRRALPPLKQPGWTLLVQGVDLHVAAGRDLLSRFRFVPDARLDDLMVSYASDGGGVGPHLDSYDVFLIQVHGRRRWRVGRVADDSFVDGVPLKILRHFEPEHEWLLEPGDLLYLPPRWGHDGVAVGECMTCSVGFRAAPDTELASDLLTRVAESIDPLPGRLYRDPAQKATASPGRVPAPLQQFAARAVAQALRDPQSLHTALGEALTEPKARVWFEAGRALPGARGVRLDARSRMMYDEHHVFINGESFRATGRDARLMRRLADDRTLRWEDVRALSQGAAVLLDDWAKAGWLHGGDDDAA